MEKLSVQMKMSLSKELHSKTKWGRQHNFWRYRHILLFGLKNTLCSPFCILVDTNWTYSLLLVYVNSILVLPRRMIGEGTSEIEMKERGCSQSGRNCKFRNVQRYALKVRLWIGRGSRQNLASQFPECFHENGMLCIALSLEVLPLPIKMWSLWWDL